MNNHKWLLLYRLFDRRIPKQKHDENTSRMILSDVGEQAHHSLPTFEITGSISQQTST